MDELFFSFENDVIYVTDGKKTGEFPLQDLKLFLKPTQFNVDITMFLIVGNMKWLLALIFMAQQTERYKLLDEFPLFQRMLGCMVHSPEFELLEQVMTFSGLVYNLDLEDYQMKITMNN